jgi:predicted DNA-binding transcriptional regulator YafY
VPWGRIWTCPAWCELREGFRVFRVDRIESCQDSGDTFALIPGRTYGDYLETLRIPKDEAR